MSAPAHELGFGLIGFIAHAALWMWCFAALGWSFLRTVASVSVTSIVAALALGFLWLRAELLGEWFGPAIVGFGGAGAIGTFAGFLRLAVPPRDRD